MQQIQNSEIIHLQYIAANIADGELYFKDEQNTYYMINHKSMLLARNNNGKTWGAGFEWVGQTDLIITTEALQFFSNQFQITIGDLKGIIPLRIMEDIINNFIRLTPH